MENENGGGNQEFRCFGRKKIRELPTVDTVDQLVGAAVHIMLLSWVRNVAVSNVYLSVWSSSFTLSW